MEARMRTLTIQDKLERFLNEIDNHTYKQVIFKRENVDSIYKLPNEQAELYFKKIFEVETVQSMLIGKRHD